MVLCVDVYNNKQCISIAAAMRSERCRVVVKARPTFDDPQEALNDSITLPAPGRIFLGKEFEADHVYLPHDGDAVYEDEVEGLVASMYQGFNATVFAYGASGSGKTHTVLGSKGHAGLINRVIVDLFKRYDPRTCTVMLSIEELYCEEFTDLLAQHERMLEQREQAKRQEQAGSKQQAKKKKEQAASKRDQANVSKSTYTGRQSVVTSAEELERKVQGTLKKRQTAATQIHERSSRSHVIVTLSLEQRVPVFSRSSSSSDSGSGSSSPAASRSSSAVLGQQAAGELDSPRDNGAADCNSDSGRSPVTTYLLGKLHLVDLAGSENIKRSGAEGQQQKEAGEINKSLCHLKTVIEEVFRGGRVSTYRNSKLTMRLKDALGGGNSKLLMIACISTAKANLPETKETLRFAEMARSIKNTPVVNREPKDEIIQRLQQELEELRDQLDKEKRGGTSAEQLQQLNAMEAAFTELLEEKEELEKKRAEEAAASQQQSDTQQQQLAAAHSREAALMQQAAAHQAEMQQLRHLLQLEQAEVQRTITAKNDAVALLQAAGSDLLDLGSQCTQLTQQLDAQQTAAGAVNKLCREQQQLAKALQQQLGDQATELEALTQLLKMETAAHAAAEQDANQLQQQLEQESSGRTAAEQSACQLEQELQQEKAAAAAAEQVLQQQLAAARQDAAQLRKQLQAEKQERLRALSTLSSAQQGMEQVSVQCQKLQQRLDQQQSSHAAGKSSCAAAVADARYLQQQLTVQSARSAALQQQLAAERAHVAALNTDLQQQQEQQQAEREAAAEQAAQMGAQQQVERETWQRASETARATIAELRIQLEGERAAHAEAMSALQQRHNAELEQSLQHSVQKLQQDKLRCKEHLQLQVHNLMADAQSLSEALATNLAELPGTPTTTLPGVAASPAAAALQQPGGQPRVDSRYQQQLAPDGEQPREDQQELLVSSEDAADEAAAGSAGSEDEGAVSGDDEDSAAGEDGYHDIELSDGSTCSLASAYLEGEGLLQHQQQDGERVARTCLDVHLPVLAITRDTSAAAAAAGAGAQDGSEGGDGFCSSSSISGGASSSSGWPVSSSGWPVSYKPEGEVDLAAASRAFADVHGGALKVEQLKKWLKGRKWDGQPHSNTLPCGTRKRKNELVQDMIAWHTHHLTTSETTTAGAAAPGTSSSNSSPVSTGPSSSTARSRASGSVSPAGSEEAAITPLSSSCRASVIETIDLCTPDTVKAAAAAAAAACAAATAASAEHMSDAKLDQKTPRTPRSVGASSQQSPAAAAAAAASPASKGSSIWSLLTPRSNKKKKAAAAAAAAATGTGARAVECDIAGLAAGDRQQRAGAAAIAEGVVRGSAVEQFLLLEAQGLSPGPAVPLSTLQAAGLGAGAGRSRIAQGPSACSSMRRAGEIRVAAKQGRK